MFSGEHAQSSGGRVIRSVISFIAMIVMIIALSWGLRTFVFQAYGIPSGSMENTIEVGDMVFSEKITYYGRDPLPGEIVTFNDPEIPSRVLIKRVIATGGQTVDLVDGQVVVDGVPLIEPYTEGKPSEPLAPSYGTSITYPYTVPAGELWVMGDNRTNSQDSRYFGSVDVSSVTGRAVCIYWPLSSIGLLD